MRRLVGLACAALVLLPACSAAPTPIEPTAKSPTSAGPVSARPTTTLEPPTLPKEAKRNDETGAANFVAYWVSVSNFAARTGDTRLLRQISQSNCVGCHRYIDLYESTYEKGGSFEGGDNTLQDVSAQRATNGVYISGRLVAAPGHFVVKAGAPRRASPTETTEVTFLARYSYNRWVMVDVGLTGS